MNRRSNLLDIIKGLMIIFIIITHFRFVYPDDYLKYGFFFWIDMAVPVFMIITGYLCAMQFEKKGIDTLEKAWSKEIIIPKALRFLVPFSIAFLVEAPVLVIRGCGIVELIQTFVRGGRTRFVLHTNYATTNFCNSYNIFYSKTI